MNGGGKMSVGGSMEQNSELDNSPLTGGTWRC